MKKMVVIAGVAGLAVLVLGTFSLAFAQTETPPSAPSQGYGYGYGMMGGRGGFGGMHGAWYGDEHGSYHETMLATFAEALGLTVAQIEPRLESGETMWQIAAAEGFNADEFDEVMLEARQTMLAQAVEEGTLTQGQADFMASRWGSRGFGLGYGGCQGDGIQGGYHRGPGGRWNNP